MDKPLVSITINTRNEERHIENCLKSILAQTYPSDRIEIIVVDNRSEDRTKEIARKYTELVFDKGPERSAQKNFGLLHIAAGKYLMHLDADMTLSPGLISECVGIMENRGDLVGLYIPEIIMGDRFFSQARRFERGFYNGTVIDGLRFFTKTAAIEMQGFDETLYAGEDWDFDKRLKKLGTTAIATSPLYHNESDFNLGRYLDKKAYYSQNFASYIAKWGTDDPDIRKQLGFYYRFIGVFVEKGKWKNLLCHPALTGGMLYLRFRVGLRYLAVKRRTE